MLQMQFVTTEISSEDMMKGCKKFVSRW